MDIPSEVLKCVVFIGYANIDDEYFYAGTGVLMSHNSVTYVVSARHVIDGIRDKGCDTVWLRVNTRDQGAIWLPMAISK